MPPLPPPSPLKVSHEKDGCERRPHRLQDSYFPLPGPWIRYIAVQRHFPELLNKAWQVVQHKWVITILIWITKLPVTKTSSEIKHLL